MADRRTITLKKHGTLVIDETPREFPFGERGKFPLHWYVDRTRADYIKALNMPGVHIRGTVLDCAWDAVPALATYLGEECPALPDLSDLPLPGLERFKSTTGITLRQYQKQCISFLAPRSHGFCSLGTRLGKTRTMLVLSDLVGAEKVLITTPAFVRRAWAEETWKVLGEEVVFPCGRAQSELRIFCGNCQGKGRVQVRYADRILRAKDKKKKRKKKAGPASEDAIGMQASSPRDDELIWDHCPKCLNKSGQSFGDRVLTDKDEILDALRIHRFCVINPDILIAQKNKTLRGVEYREQRLPGWCPTLSGLKWDVCLIDESHQQIRNPGLKKDKETGHVSKKDRLLELTDSIPRVYAITATPMMGLTRDLWPQLDSISKGLWGSISSPRMPWLFAKSFCLGGINSETGFWSWDGRSDRADTELESRLKMLMFKRSMADVAAEMPPKIRQVVRIDVNAVKQDRKRLKGEDNKGVVTRLLRRAGDMKRPVVIEYCLQEMAEGRKIVVFAHLKESVETFAKELAKEMRSRKWARVMRQVDAEVWAVHGGMSKGIDSEGKELNAGGGEKQRHVAARSFREWPGAGCFVANIQSFQVGVSLSGATSVFFLELTYSPAELIQAESRPYEIGSRGLTVVYFVATHTLDDRVIERVLPKFAQLEAGMADRDAKSTLEAFGRSQKPEEEFDLDKEIAALCQGLEE